ncbi:MAG: HD domain-containing protein [Lachnospiraceae bacterium]|nr:HD domain-containing protein [Lachnospiraceae bacterium]
MKLSELLSLLKNATEVEELDKNRNDIEALIPQVKIMFNYDQKNRYHQFDLWMHSLHTVVNLPKNRKDDMLYLAALLHDIGKPTTRCKGTREGDTDLHYYGHPLRSMEIVRDEVIPVLNRKGNLLSDLEVKRLLYYVEHHDDRMSVKLKHVRRHLKLVDFEEFQNLMLLQVADAKAHVLLPIVVQRIETCTKLAGEEGQDLYQKLLEE